MCDLPRNLWFPLFLSREITRQPKRFERLGDFWMVCRLPDGSLFMAEDRCPHMGASLTDGTIDQGEIQCPFHGFRFNSKGDCTLVPALGTHGKISPKLKLKTIPLRDIQGWIWGWWGDEDPNESTIPHFAEIDDTWRWQDIARDWDVHVTRAIENQLDVAHLPFVHRKTIGAGCRTLVEGPYVESDSTAIRVWVTNRKDDGQPPRTLEMLEALSKTQPASLEFRFPGLWLLRIHSGLRLLVAFVPVRKNRTRFYIRACHRIRIPLLGAIYSRLLGFSNRWILQEDERVVSKIRPECSLDAHRDILIGSDRAIIQFRKIWRRRLERPVAGTDS